MSNMLYVGRPKRPFPATSRRSLLTACRQQTTLSWVQRTGARPPLSTAMRKPARMLAGPPRIVTGEPYDAGS